MRSVPPWPMARVCSASSVIRVVSWESASDDFGTAIRGALAALPAGG